MSNSINYLINRLSGTSNTISSQHQSREVVKLRIMLFFSAVTGRAYVKVVDDKLNVATCGSNEVTGTLRAIMQGIERFGNEDEEAMWDENIAQGLSLANHPEMIYLLLKCDNLLVDADGKSISSDNEVRRLTLKLTDLGAKDEAIYLTDIAIIADDEAISVRPLSDSFVLGENNRIYPIEPIGDNYQQLALFKHIDVKESTMEDFLSIFYSYISNVDLDRTHYRVVKSPEAIEAVPTLCFEKVDTDKALYLRVMNSLPGNDNELIERMKLSVHAVIGIDKVVELKTIVRRPLEESVAILSKILNEQAPSRQARKEIYQEGEFFIVPEESAGPFLFNALPSLLKHFALLGAERLRDYKVTHVTPRLNVNLSSGIDFLEGDATMQIGDETMSINDVLNTWRKQRYITLSDGNRALIAADYMRRLERIFDTSKKRGGKIRISFFDLPEVEELLQERLEGEVFERHRKVYQGFNELRQQKLPKPKVKAKLRDYQQEGVKWIKYLYDNKLGGCLADDMGLGKTLQAITVLATIYPKVKHPSLIVMPRSLIFNWENEIEKFAPQLKTYTYYGTDRDLKEAMKAQVILTTYAVVRNDIETLAKKEFHYVILDESQNIKNVSSQAAQAVHILKTDHRLALSGTPVENNLTELYSLFRFLNPAMFGTLDNFNQRYTYPIQRENDKGILKQLRHKIFPFLLRRLKKDVLKELPDRINQTLYVEMNEKQQKLYEERRKYYKSLIDSNIKREGIQKSQFVMFQALNELRQIASIPENYSDGNIRSPKTEQLIDSLTEAVENGHKVVVFFNFLTGIELVAERLAAMGIGYVEMTGATTNRQKVVDTFQKSPDCMVMLMTLKTGGVGLNLTAADTVFIFEPWWNKAAEEQAINRLHRIGQTQKVLAYSIIAQGTIEEKILTLQQQKAELFEGLIGSDSSSAKVLTEEDINFILG